MKAISFTMAINYQTGIHSNCFHFFSLCIDLNNPDCHLEIRDQLPFEIAIVRTPGGNMPRILLAGFERVGDYQFALKLTRLGHEVRTQATGTLDFGACDIVFALSDDIRWTGLLDQMRRQRTVRPLVLVDRVASDEGWINALEAGVTDYCSFDVEPTHLRFIVENSQRRKAAAVAA